MKITPAIVAMLKRGQSPQCEATTRLGWQCRNPVLTSQTWTFTNRGAIQWDDESRAHIRSGKCRVHR